ncbi:MAG: UDP-N-acetylmuramate dehydrogenase [Pseudomonadota bacterium]
MIVEDYPIIGTLGVKSHAAFGATVKSSDELMTLLPELSELALPVYWLGEGSNIVPQMRVNAVVVQIQSTSHAVIDEQETTVTVRVEAGVNWHQFVMQCLQRGWFGLENLALIPGSVGAVPVQNVGAYGVEVSQYIQAVHGYTLAGEAFCLSNADCGFAYRHSVFKEDASYAITAVDFALLKEARSNISYPELGARFTEQRNPRPVDVARAVIDIRSQKLPDPHKNPNVGSFFKNPVVSVDEAQLISSQFPSLTCFRQDNGDYKLSAAQLIDLSGGKKLIGEGVQCWPRQPLVLVTQECEDAQHVLDFAKQVADRVSHMFGIALQTEPQIWE